MPYRLAIAFVNWLPNHWYRMNASAARLGFAFESFAGARHHSYLDWLEPWMRPDVGDGGRQAGAVYGDMAVEDVDLAFDLGFLSQPALVALGPKRLRSAGAFRADRNTDTTIRGG